MVSVTDLETRQEEIAEELAALDNEFQGQQFSDEARARWNELNEERDRNKDLVDELVARQERVDQVTSLSQRDGNSERPVKPAPARGGLRVSRIPDDPTRIEEYRNQVNTMDDLEQLYRDGAMKVLERITPAHPAISREDAQSGVARMLDTIDHGRGEDGPRALARRVIATSSRGYQREFGAYVASGGQRVGTEMERAASLTVGSGGYAVPVFLDPTVILVSSGVINPVRQLARVVQTTANTLEYITSTGITAAYGAEALEASDNTPALVQPTLNVEKAFAFVPMSIEISEDWAGIQTEMARMFADAKDVLENTKFLTGVGHASTEPQGLIAVGGATAVVTSAGTATIAAADLYSLETALQPRWRARASIVGNRSAFQKVRQLDTAGGANLWVQLQFGNPATLLGYPAYEWSAYSSAVTTTGSTVLTIGDFNQFLIADRVGMSVEFIPHLFGGSNRYPTGQRGLYMYWRNSSKVLTPGVVGNSAFVSLKLL